MTPDELDAAIAAVFGTPEELRRRSDEAARRLDPTLTDEQLDATWEQMAAQFGLIA